MRHYPSAKDLARITKPGRYAVGNGAYLQISQRHTRAWIFRYRVGERQYHMGLGPCEYVTLQEARSKAWEAQRLRLNGVDPLEAKRQQKAARRPSVAARSFKDCAIAYIDAHQAGWRGNGSRNQWTQSLEKYVFPKLGHLSIAEIDTPRVLSVLEPIWTKIPETARRIRNRIELILGYAVTHGLRSGDNPARWTAHLQNILPRVNGKTHLPAMPWQEMPAFMKRLCAEPENAARALELQILTAARPGEILGMKWDEVRDDVWIIPAERMKSGREHRVPLSPAAVRLLKFLPRVGDYVFVGRDSFRPPAAQTLVRQLRAMDVSNITAHGFRSAFRDWAAEATSFENHVVEMALAHTVGNGVERAYRRGDLFEKRRALLEAWSAYLSGGM
jgi:integrase